MALEGKRNIARERIGCLPKQHIKDRRDVCSKPSAAAAGEVEATMDGK